MSGVAGRAYFLVMPDTNHKTPKHHLQKPRMWSLQNQRNERTPFDAVLRTLHPAERSIVEVLQAHDCKYLHIK
jgi:hypothetical protein